MICNHGNTCLKILSQSESVKIWLNENQYASYGYWISNFYWFPVTNDWNKKIS